MPTSAPGVDIWSSESDRALVNAAQLVEDGIQAPSCLIIPFTDGHQTRSLCHISQFMPEPVYLRGIHEPLIA